jgi:hypothetical protein
MAKRRFTDTERFAVWMHNGQRCYWCLEPLSLQETTIDHVIPEHLEDKPETFEMLRVHLGLPTTFVINDYCNWLPAHDRCNKSKSGKSLQPSPMVTDILEKLIRKADTVRKFALSLAVNTDKQKILGRVMAAVENGHIKKEDIFNLFAPERANVDNPKLLQFEERLMVDRSRWHVMGVQRDLATVTDGRLVGETPMSGGKVDLSWLCPSCHQYGPWNGVRCLTCGRMNDFYS